jgi:multidrug efflux system membrane fusion protein
MVLQSPTAAAEMRTTSSPGLDRLPAGCRHCSGRSSWASLPVLATLAVTLALAGCSRQSGEAKAGKPGGSTPVPVLATQAVSKTMPVELRAVGNAQAFSTVAVRSRITGELTAVHFTEGQEVRQGDRLFTIDPRPVRAALEQAQASLARDCAQADNAKIELQRQGKLLESALISRDEFDKAEANWKALQAAVQADAAAVTNALLNLEFTEIRAPVEARAGDLRVHAGNVVQAVNDVLVTLRQMHPIQVAFAVPEHFLGEIKQRMARAPLTIEARVPGVESPELGELKFVDNNVETTTGTLQLKGHFANQDRVLWPGQFVEVVLRLKDLTNAVVVPAQAVQRGQTNEFVFLVKPDQTVEMRPVKPGLSRDGETVIEHGLAAGDMVVTDGQLRLVPGAKVSVKPGLMEAAAATGGKRAP